MQITENGIEARRENSKLMKGYVGLWDDKNCARIGSRKDGQNLIFQSTISKIAERILRQLNKVQKKIERRKSASL